MVISSEHIDISDQIKQQTKQLNRPMKLYDREAIKQVVQSNRQNSCISTIVLSKDNELIFELLKKKPCRRI